MKTIVWDVDDTLNDLMRLWLEWFRLRNGKSGVLYEDLKQNPPHRLLGISRADYLRSYDKFRLSGIYSSMRPDGELLAWFRGNGGRYRHMALTSVPLKAAHESASWVYRYFGRWIRTFHVVPSKRSGERLPCYSDSKAGFIRMIGGCDIFIDDSPENIAQVEVSGFRCLTVPRPWNSAKGDIAGLLEKIR